MSSSRLEELVTGLIEVCETVSNPDGSLEEVVGALHVVSLKYETLLRIATLDHRNAMKKQKVDAVEEKAKLEANDAE